MRKIIIILTPFFVISTLLGSEVQPQVSDHSSSKPLPVQMESKYVTDRSLWGQLIFDRSKGSGTHEREEDKIEIMNMIETYHRAWLDGNNENLYELLDEDIIRFRGETVSYGLPNTLEKIKNESRGERPAGYLSSMQLEIDDLQIRSEKDFSIALYGVGIRGGARWEYSDVATIFQVFKKVNNKWKIVGHIESFTLDNPEISNAPDSVPDRRAPFTFDFVYPVKDLQRAMDFYSPLLGLPEIVTLTTASYRVRDSYFELNAKPTDERINIITGRANGYAVINVSSLSDIRNRIGGEHNKNIQTKSCDRDECLITEDTSGNIIIWREYIPTDTSQFSPIIKFPDSYIKDPVFSKLIESMKAWTANDYSTLVQMHTNKSLWLDDSFGIAEGKAMIEQALQSRWELMDRGPDGIDAVIEIKNFKNRNIGNRYLASAEMRITMQTNKKRSFDSLLTQIWKKDDTDMKLEHTLITQTTKDKAVPVNSMDYTAYPVDNLGRAGRFYKNLFVSEPYRDENWFGFWSTTSVFGLVGPMSNNSWRPIAHRANGYADLSIRSAEEVYKYLKSKGAAFPVVKAINDTPGIDKQPGYNQILAVDSEGNLINFSEYLEY